MLTDFSGNTDTYRYTYTHTQFFVNVSSLGWSRTDLLSAFFFFNAYKKVICTEP